MVERSNLAQSFQDVSKSFLVSLSAMIWNHRELYPVSQLTHDEFLGHHQPAQVPRELCDGPVPLDAGDRALELSIEMMIAREFLDGFSGGAPAVKAPPKLIYNHMPPLIAGYTITPALLVGSPRLLAC